MWGQQEVNSYLALPAHACSHAHLLTRCEGSQLLDLGGLVVAAPPAEQDLAAHPLLRLCGVTGTGHTAYHVVQVFHVLCGDRLVVVSILGKGGGSGQCGPLRDAPGLQTTLPWLLSTFLLMLPQMEPSTSRCREATQSVHQGRLWGAPDPRLPPQLCP